MFLAFQLTDIVTVPFGWLLGFLYDLLNNYGLAMIVFAVLVQLILLPITMKSKKGMMKMSRLQPKIQEIKEKYANDQQKQNEAIQKLQQEEGASMGCSGCLWSLLPMLILLPLFSVIRQPIVYILGESLETAEKIIQVIKELDPSVFGTNTYYDQVAAAQAISKYSAEIAAAIPGISEETLQGLNFNFLGIDMGNIPNWKFWAWESVTWSAIGAFLVPLLSAGQQMLSMHISQKTNNSVITDENGMQDKETAANSQTAQQSKMMMYMMPVMSLWIGFTVPAALSLYWFVGGVVRMVEDTILTKHYRKIYDAEDAIRLQKYLEQEAIEAEKERIRAEKRAANPEGITANTSKKKLQQKQKEEQEAAKAAAAREYAARKGIALEEDEEESKTLSGVADRPYCKGRAYDPNRYHSTEE